MFLLLVRSLTPSTSVIFAEGSTRSSRMRTTKIYTCTMLVLCSWFAKSAAKLYKSQHTQPIRLGSARTVNTSRSVPDASKLFTKALTRLTCRKRSAFQLSHLQLQTDVPCAIWILIRERKAGSPTWSMRAVKTTHGSDVILFSYISRF